jgi:LacI family transcriptional regulator
MARTTRQTTLADVAAAAGVSTATASRALRDSPLVSVATRRRVQRTAATLGFEPDRVARSLRTRSSMLIGLVVPDIAIAFYANALKGAQEVLERAGYQVLVVNTEREAGREREGIKTLLAHRVDGLLIATSGGQDLDEDVPVVLFDQLAGGRGAASVAPANREGATTLAAHLLAHGHTSLGYVGGPLGHTAADERLRGFTSALDAAGVPPRPELIRFGDARWSEASGQRATQQLLSLEAPPTAIVAAGDTLALGALRALRRAGYSVPRDVALVSFDDPVSGDLLDPPFTALARHDRELGERAAELLLGVLAGDPPAADERIPLGLIVRRSCGCVSEPRE